MILGETVALVLPGFAAGGPLTLASTSLVSGRLSGVAANDPMTIFGAALAIGVVSLAAAAAPARRAAKVDPMVALRCE